MTPNSNALTPIASRIVPANTGRQVSGPIGMPSGLARRWRRDRAEHDQRRAGQREEEIGRRQEQVAEVAPAVADGVELAFAASDRVRRRHLHDVNPGPRRAHDHLGGHLHAAGAQASRSAASRNARSPLWLSPIRVPKKSRMTELMIGQPMYRCAHGIAPDAIPPENRFPSTMSAPLASGATSGSRSRSHTCRRRRP